MNAIKKISAGLIIAAFSLPAMANQVDLNTASKDELLKGIQGLSEQQAQAIIDYRDEKGAFVKIPQLLHIGIGPDIIGPNYNNITVGAATGGDMKNWGAN